MGLLKKDKKVSKEKEVKEEEKHEVQTEFNEDSIEVLNEDGEVENVCNENN